MERDLEGKQKDAWTARWKLEGNWVEVERRKPGGDSGREIANNWQTKKPGEGSTLEDPELKISRDDRP